jgi:hypothetical protein
MCSKTLRPARKPEGLSSEEGEGWSCCASAVLSSAGGPGRGGARDIIHGSEQQQSHSQRAFGVLNFHSVKTRWPSRRPERQLRRASPIRR